MNQENKNIFNQKLGSRKISAVGLAILKRPFFWQSAPLQNVHIIEESNLKLKSRKSKRSNSEEERDDENEAIESIGQPLLESSALNALYRAIGMQAILHVPQIQTLFAPPHNHSLSKDISQKEAILGTFENKENTLKKPPETLDRPLPESHPKSNLPSHTAPLHHNVNRKEEKLDSPSPKRGNVLNPIPEIKTNEKKEVASTPLSTLNLTDSASMEKNSISSQTTSLTISSMPLQNSETTENSALSETSNGALDSLKNEDSLVKKLSSISSELSPDATLIQEHQTEINQVSSTGKTLQKSSMEIKDTQSLIVPSSHPSISSLDNQQKSFKNEPIPLAQNERTPDLTKKNLLSDALIPQPTITTQTQKPTMNSDPFFIERSNPIFSSKEELRSSLAQTTKMFDSALPKASSSKGEISGLKTNASLDQEKPDSPRIFLEKKASEGAPLPLLFRNEGVASKASFPIAKHELPAVKASLPIVNRTPSLTKPQTQESGQKYSVERLMSGLKNLTKSIFSQSSTTPVARNNSQESISISDNPPIVEHPETVQEKPLANPEFTAKVYSQPVIIEDYWGVGRL